MADDSGKTPAPRPRRRRSDKDPTFKEPKVAYERRRSKARATPPPPPVEPPWVDVVPAAADAPAATEAPGVVDTAAGETSALEDPAASRPGSPFAAAPVRPAAAGLAPLPMIEDRSPNPAVCPFLRSVDGDTMRAPIETPDAGNRCAALREAVPQSLRQQELVCLTSGHVNCPRYLRGAVVLAEPTPAAVQAGRAFTPALLASIAILVSAFVVSAAFVVSRGSLEIAAVSTPSTSPSATSVAAAPGQASPSTDPVVVPTTSAAPTPSESASPAPTPTPTEAPAPTPSPTRTPKPTSDRYDLLEPCPRADDCWIYTVRAGDNLVSIANYFGVPLARVRAMNPWLESTGLRSGQELRLPPPTR